MASNTNNGGGSHNHLSPSSSWSQQGPAQENAVGTADKIGPPMAIAFVAFAVLIYLVCSRVLPTETQEQEAAGGGDDDTIVRPLQSNEPGDRASTVASAAAVEMVPTADPPLVLTYRKEDGWREGSCGVCLADLDDGEAVRVLPACMHYFHAACVGEWLRRHATCPLCRTPLVAAPDTGRHL